MLVSVTEAARLVGIARQTINRHVRAGKLSATNDNGKKFIETSELMRVYGKIKLPDVPKGSNDIVENVTQGSKNQEALILKLLEQIEVLNKKVDHLTLRLEYKPPAQPEKTKIKPEDDPEWPREIKSFADVTLRNEIKARYH